MAAASPARTTALHLLGAQRRRAARARDLLRGADEMRSLGSRGRALATRLVLGVNAASGELDRRVDGFVARPSQLEPRVRDALRLAAFELLYLDTPRQVAASQGVELVRSVQPRAARMANAVLRRIADCRSEVDVARIVVGEMAQGRALADTRELCCVSGYPAWLVERLVEDLGAVRAARACLCALEPAPVYASLARPSATEADVEGRLRELGLSPEADGLPGSWKLGGAAGLASGGLVQRGDVVVSDLAAQIVCRVAAPCSGRVLEVGQGRGTKSLLLARVMDELDRCGADASPAKCAESGEGQLGRCGSDACGSRREPRVVGCELVASKVGLCAERMAATGLSERVSCVNFDATRLGESDVPAELAGPFEVVLVDAPCSGTGTMRRHPEIPWQLDLAALAPAGDGTLPDLQLRMLRAAASRVAIGGELVYATCSVLSAENEGVVGAFLESPEGVGFERADVASALGVLALPEEGRALVARWRTEAGAFQSSPARGGCDGHFCARLRRVR